MLHAVVLIMNTILSSVAYNYKITHISMIFNIKMELEYDVHSAFGAFSSCCNPITMYVLIRRTLFIARNTFGSGEYPCYGCFQMEFQNRRSVKAALLVHAIKLIYSLLSFDFAITLRNCMVIVWIFLFFIFLTVCFHLNSGHQQYKIKKVVLLETLFLPV